MKFTDIFVRRPVLSLVVSLLILLIGGMSMLGAADPAISAALQHDDHGHDGLSRRLARSDPGLYHDADRTGRVERRGHRLPDLELDAEHQHRHRLRQAQLRSEPGADRRDGQGAAGQIPDAATGAGPDHPEIDRPDDRGHVYRLRQRRAVRRGDLRLSDPRRAAAARHRRRRRLGRYPGRPDLRDAAVARPGAHGLVQHLGQRREPPRFAPTTTSPLRARRKASILLPTSRPIPG